MPEWRTPVVYPSFLPQTGPVPKLGTPAPRQIKLVVLVGQASQAKEEGGVIVETLIRLGG